MPATLDHLLWGSRDLDTAVDELFKRSGVRAAAGGHHPELGTWNALARLGPDVFLEVIAPDPTLQAGAFAHRLATLTEPTIVMWAARTADAARTAERAHAAGWEVTAVDGHRVRPDGEVVRWTNVFVSGHGAGTLVPFFIEWRSPVHPADGAPDGLVLESFTIETPEPATLRDLLAALDVKVAVRKGAHDRLRATIKAGRKSFVLTGPDPTAIENAVTRAASRPPRVRP